MGYSGGAKTAIEHTAASVTSRIGKLQEGTSDTRNGIGLLIGSKRSFAVSVKNGQKRICST